MAKLSPFDFLNSINQSKDDLMIDAETEKAYPAYMVNRGLSYFPDTVFYANEMNLNHHIDNHCQYSFLINTIRKRKRFSKWFKPEETPDIEVVKEYYAYNNTLARQALTLLTPEQIIALRHKVSHGGTKQRK